jgi:hypothetical protein
MQAAAEALPDDPDNRSDDEIQVMEVPGVPNVDFFSYVSWWRGPDDPIPVSRPAHRDFGLHCGGSSSWTTSFSP